MAQVASLSHLEWRYSTGSLTLDNRPVLSPLLDQVRYGASISVHTENEPLSILEAQGVC